MNIDWKILGKTFFDFIGTSVLGAFVFITFISLFMSEVNFHWSYYGFAIMLFIANIFISYTNNIRVKYWSNKYLEMLNKKFNNE